MKREFLVTFNLHLWSDVGRVGRVDKVNSMDLNMSKVMEADVRRPTSETIIQWIRSLEDELIDKKYTLQKHKISIMNFILLGKVKK